MRSATPRFAAFAPVWPLGFDKLQDKNIHAGAGGARSQTNQRSGLALAFAVIKNVQTCAALQ